MESYEYEGQEQASYAGYDEQGYGYEGQEEQGTVHGAKVVSGIRRMRARALRCIGLDGEMFRFDSEWSKPFRGLSVCLLRCS